MNKNLYVCIYTKVEQKYLDVNRFLRFATII